MAVIDVKKYPNRRLYDTSRSTYVNLEDLAGLVCAGHEVRVRDSRSGEDLTKEILLQVVLEVLRGVDLLPVGMLRRIIRASGSTPSHLLLRQQLATGMEIMSAQLDRMEALLQPPPVPPPPTPVAPPPVDARSAAPAGPPDEDLSDLRRRLAELEKRLAKG